jgi:predicted dehydrogenase
MIWIVGAGNMGAEYAKVLAAMKLPFTVIGKAPPTSDVFEKNWRSPVVAGGFDSFLKTSPAAPAAAIIAVDVDRLYEVTKAALNYGVKRILLEKPGATRSSQIAELAALAKEKDAFVALAYNRRHYASTTRARDIIREDGGVTSFHFDFTEWSHVIEKQIIELNRSKETMNAWLYANASHVIDTAFFLGGGPKEMTSFVAGELSWHPRGAVFAGAGESESGALFSYNADWKAPGRWAVELMTRHRKLFLSPMEKLRIQSIGSVEIREEAIDDRLDREFKPGLYLQTERFLNRSDAALPTLRDQVALFGICDRIYGDPAAPLAGSH